MKSPGFRSTPPFHSRPSPSTPSMPSPHLHSLHGSGSNPSNLLGPSAGSASAQGSMLSISRRPSNAQEPGAAGKCCSWRTYLAGSLFLVLLAVLDVSIRPPYGVLSWHQLVGSGRHGPAVPCGWDFEASWKIGVMRGTSPSTLKQGPGEVTQNPIITCATVTGVPSSFVADPFLVITDSEGPARASGHQHQHSVGPATPQAHNAHHPQHDFAAGFPHSVQAAAGAPFLTTTTVPQPVPIGPFVSPMESPSPSAAALSVRPSLQPAAGVSASAGNSSGPWYMFYELKNLAVSRGEIGVAHSADGGYRWTHLGTALKEPFHLSYPFVMYVPQAHAYLMIPETNQNSSVRVYSTSAAEFPFGWRLRSRLLPGRRWVDTSVLLHDGRFYMFTTYEYSLHIYHSENVLSDDWHPHASSPVVSSDRRIGRSAGRVVAYDGYLWRFAQDCSHFYGEQVHVLRIDALTPTDFQEQLVRTMRPSAGGLWNAHRFHHVDAHRIDPAARGSEGMPWIAVVDGDDKPDDHHFFQREGWFYWLKRLVWIAAVTQLAVVLLLTYVFRWPSGSGSGSLPIVRKGVDTHFKSIAVVFANARINVVGWVRNAWANRVRVASALRAVALVALKIAARLGLALTLTLAITSLYPWCWQQTAGQDYESMYSLSAAASHTSQLNGFVVVTAASPLYFRNLQNLIGSLHFWEPNQRLVVYDLGLTQAQIDEAQCWSNVQIRTLPFEQLPPHVSNLYNYAFKLLVLEDALARDEAVLMLDASLEVRFSLYAIKEALAKRGYWATARAEPLLARTMPSTIEQLGADSDDLAGKEFCSGPIAFVRNSHAHKHVLVPAIQCAKNEHCIAPIGSGDGVHGFDASVLSVLFHRWGLTCASSRRFLEDDMTVLTEEPTRYNDVVIAVRRSNVPKPYRQMTRTFENCSKQQQYTNKQAQTNIAAPDQEKQQQEHPTLQNGITLIEHASGTSLSANDRMVRCLSTNANSRTVCASAIRDHQSRNAHTWSEMKADASWVVDMFQRRLRCWYSYVAFGAVLLLCLRPPSLRPLSCRLASEPYATKYARLIAFGIILLFLWSPVHHLALKKWGTFMPHNAYLYTHPYTPPPSPDGLIAGTSTPPDGWRPQHRVVVTLTTLPHQMVNLRETLESLLQQSMPLDAIYLSLPRKSKRTGELYVVPEFIEAMATKNPSLQILHSDIDYGPLTKLVPALQAEDDPSTIVITVDSDKIYPPALAQTLAWHSEHDPSTAFGVCGWSFFWMPEPMGVVPAYVPWLARGDSGRSVDVLQACCGNAYRRGFFKDLAVLSQPHPHCFTTDDLWISGYLSVKSGVKRVLIAGAWSYITSLEPSTPAWKANDPERWQLSFLNGKDGADMRCIKGVEQTLGPWRKIRMHENEP